MWYISGYTLPLDWGTFGVLLASDEWVILNPYFCMTRLDMPGMRGSFLFPFYYSGFSEERPFSLQYMLLSQKGTVTDPRL